MTDWRKIYSDLLHNSAAKWGLEVVPDRPYIEDNTSPYPKPEVCETLHWESGKHAYLDVGLFFFNGQWGFCLNVQFSGGGFGYGPFLKFCDPYPTRMAALHGALIKFNHYIARDAQSGYRYREASAMLSWLERQTQPEQLTLF